jgi:hypothetical protein
MPQIDPKLTRRGVLIASRAVTANPGPSRMLQRLDQFERFGD